MQSNSTVQGLTYLKSTYQENNEYWYKKPIMIEILDFISRIEHIGHMEHWRLLHNAKASEKLLKMMGYKGEKND